MTSPGELQSVTQLLHLLHHFHTVRLILSEIIPVLSEEEEEEEDTNRRKALVKLQLHDDRRNRVKKKQSL